MIQLYTQSPKESTDELSEMNRKIKLKIVYPYASNSKTIKNLKVPFPIASKIF